MSSLLPSPFASTSARHSSAQQPGQAHNGQNGPLTVLYESKASPSRRMVDEDDPVLNPIDSDEQDDGPATPQRRLVNAFLESSAAKLSPRPSSRQASTPPSSRSHSRRGSYAPPQQDQDQTAFEIYEDPDGKLVFQDDQEDQEMENDDDEQDESKENAKPSPRAWMRQQNAASESPGLLATPPPSSSLSAATTASLEPPSRRTDNDDQSTSADQVVVIKTPPPVLSSPDGASMVFPDWLSEVPASSFAEGINSLAAREEREDRHQFDEHVPFGRKRTSTAEDDLDDDHYVSTKKLKTSSDDDDE